MYTVEISCCHHVYSQLFPCTVQCLFGFHQVFKGFFFLGGEGCQFNLQRSGSFDYPTFALRWFGDLSGPRGLNWPSLCTSWYIVACWGYLLVQIAMFDHVCCKRFLYGFLCGRASGCCRSNVRKPVGFQLFNLWHHALYGITNLMSLDRLWGAYSCEFPCLCTTKSLQYFNIFDMLIFATIWF